VHAPLQLAAPLTKLNQSIAGFGGVPGLTSKATSPVGVPEPEFGLTLIAIGTAVPCVVFAGTVSAKFVFVGVKVALTQLFTRFAAFTDPRPVTKSYPAVVV